MKSNYSNYYAYFNSQLHKKHSSVIKTLVPDDDNRFVASVTQQPIQLLFNDNNQLYGFVYPIVDKKELILTITFGLLKLGMDIVLPI